MGIRPHQQMPDFVNQDMSQDRGAAFGTAFGCEENPGVQHRDQRNRIEGIGKSQGSRVPRRVVDKPDLDDHAFAAALDVLFLRFQPDSDSGKHSGRLVRRSDPDKVRNQDLPRHQQRDIGTPDSARQKKNHPDANPDAFHSNPPIGAGWTEFEGSRRVSPDAFDEMKDAS
jgi:hypothetical protein